MTDETTDSMEILRERILNAIDHSGRGKWSIKIKTLMSEFGFVAVQRIRQSSFLAVLDTLNQWGVEYRYDGNKANDYITLSRVSAIPTSVKVTPIKTSKESPLEQFSSISPLAFLYHLGETLEDSRSKSLAVDIMNAVWSFQPVCLIAEAGDEFFSFACGFFLAIMKRRAMRVRHGVMIDLVPRAPEIITVDHLKRFLGQTIDLNIQGEFPQYGAVYILRDSPDEFENDEIIAFTRECFIPHTYRIRAKYSTTSGDAPQVDRAANAPGFNLIINWISGFAGTLQRSQALVEQQIDLSSLLAEASQIRDALLERQALRPTDNAFRAGFESTEHMALKSALLNGLRRMYPSEAIAVEESLDPRKDDTFADQDLVDFPRRDKPDIKVGNTLWVEVETMRALSMRGSNPFFVLETKLRQKLPNMSKVQEVWLIVPNDIALLASEQLGALTRNLNAVLGSNKLRCGFLDIIAESPVFLTSEDILMPEVRLSGVSWHRPNGKHLDKPLTWDDIAGYGDLKERLREDLLDPLLFPEKYSKHGLFAANGLLLYGLPGCGKSLIGRVLAAETGLVCRLIVPSDMTSMWLG
ncbi:MAG: ATP-binding protein, partial [Methanothrix sp.]